MKFTLLDQPCSDLITKIHSGTLADETNYMSLGKDDFIRHCRAAKSNEVVQLKYDGWWCAVTPSGLFTKDGLFRSQLISTPSDMIVIGEYIFGTQWANDSPYRDRVVFWSTNKKSIPKSLSSRFVAINNYSPMFIVNNFDAIAAGHEGYVLKDLTDGSFFRYKKEYTGDYVIMECIRSGASTLSGWACNQVRIGLYNKETGKVESIGTSSGFDDNMKADMYAHPGYYEGGVAQFTGKKVFKSGKLRHPAFNRMRDDKRVEDCTLDQFKGLI
jgi:hypothetical protein